MADRVIGDTIIRQLVRFVGLRHSQGPDGQCAAYVDVLVTMYAALGAGRGPELNGAGFAPYAVSLVADNQTIVDAATGRILAIRQGENQADWLALAEGYPQDTMLQGDFFEQLREQPLRIGDMIRQHIAQADAMGRFA